MAKNYQWRMTTNYVSDTSLSYGVTPSTWQNWQTDTAGDRDGGTISYWYRDSNTETGGVWSDANSSRVVIEIRQRWNSAIDDRNNLIVTINTTLNSVRRDDIRGTNYDTPGRVIDLYKDANGGSPLLSFTDNQLATAHTIYSGPTIIESKTITIPPGLNATGGQMRIYNYSPGFPSYDDIRIGVQFRNILPKDYRPGATLDADNGTWLSHDRSGGKCHILTSDNGTWAEMRTQDGDSGRKGNTPSILHADNETWFNQKKLGKS